MKTLLYIALFIALWHFVYESIIAPSIRMHLRNKLFALRDELRAAKAEGQIGAEDEQAFWFVHEGINSFLNRLPSLTFSTLNRIRRAHIANPTVRETLADHLQKVQAAKAPVLSKVFNRTNRVIRRTMLVNAGGWFVYLIPIAICILLTKSLTKVAKSLLLTPPQVVARYIPLHKHAH